MTIDLEKSPYDLNTYWGRVCHFFRLTNPLNILASNDQLDEAKNAVDSFKKTKKLPQGMDEDKLWEKKYLYDSAFHPDTGEKMFVVGRMAAQVPMNTIITGGLITYYSTTAQTVFWQWINQSFNAVVNYTNRSGDAPIPTSQLIASYCAACGGALTTALYLNNKVKNMNPIAGRIVPFAAITAANFINIPMMRSSEIRNGTPVYSEDGQRMGLSKRAAITGIGLVCLSRIMMAMPSMIITPLITNHGIKSGWFCRWKRAILPLQLGLVGLCALFATPLACAIFPQKSSISTENLEPELQEAAKKKNAKQLYYNKGL